MEAKGKGWFCNNEVFDKLNTLFETNATLYNTTVEKAPLENSYFDVAMSISVLEHLPWTDVENVVGRVWDVLKPGGIFILTVDLFLDIYPFENAEKNKYGSNVNLCALANIRPFQVEIGNGPELYGFAEFDAKTILKNKNKYLMGRGYPAMVQCLVLRKPLSASVD